VIVILIQLAVYFTIADEGQRIREEMTIDSMYASANLYVNKGLSEDALSVFTDIIARDKSQEKAEYAVGKI
jgi:hypothetical protein